MPTLGAISCCAEGGTEDGTESGAAGGAVLAERVRRLLGRLIQRLLRRLPRRLPLAEGRLSRSPSEPVERHLDRMPTGVKGGIGM